MTGAAASSAQQIDPATDSLEKGESSRAQTEKLAHYSSHEALLSSSCGEGSAELCSNYRKALKGEDGAVLAEAEAYAQSLLSDVKRASAIKELYSSDLGGVSVSFEIFIGFGTQREARTDLLQQIKDVEREVAQAVTQEQNGLGIIVAALQEENTRQGGIPELEGSSSSFSGPASPASQDVPVAA